MCQKRVVVLATTGPAATPKERRCRRLCWTCSVRGHSRHDFCFFVFHTFHLPALAGMSGIAAFFVHGVESCAARGIDAFVSAAEVQQGERYLCAMRGQAGRQALHSRCCPCTALSIALKALPFNSIDNNFKHCNQGTALAQERDAPCPAI
eukprot:1138986-Pelagomonas_calceolata.AAC.7